MDAIQNLPQFKFEMKTDIKPKQQEIVDKCLVFNEAIKEHGREFSEIDRVQKLATELEFSESTIKGLEFAEADIANPAIGNYTFGTLNMLIQEVGSSVEQNTLLSMAFPDKAVSEYEVMIDRIAGNSGILPEFYGENSTLPTIKPLNTYGFKYQPGLWGGRTSLLSKDLVFARKRGAGNFNERGIGQLVAYNTINIVTQAVTRKKFLLNAAVFNNQYIYGDLAISSNIPASNYIAMYESMGTLNPDGSVTYSTVDPLYTPLIAITNILNNPIFIKYRRFIRGVAVNGADLQAIMNHPNVKATTNMLIAAGQSLGNKKMEVQVGDLVKELNAYYAPGFDFPLLADDDDWVNQTTTGNMDNSQQNFFLPRGKMYILLDIPDGPSGAFHLTYNEVDPNVETPAMGLYTGVFNRNLQNSDTVNRLDIVGALSGGPAVYRPEAQFILTGLYSNV